MSAPTNSPVQDNGYSLRKVTALMEANKAVLEERDFPTAARRIFDACCQLTGARSGYVAMLSATGEENEVLFLEAGGLPCTVDPLLPMPIRGLRADAYHLRQAVYENDFHNSHWMDFMPGGHVHLRNVMFAPLVLDGKAVGLLGVANKEGDFTDEDAAAAQAFGELAAIALRNSRTREELARSQQLLAATGRAAHVGGWEIDLVTNELRWSEEVHRIHETPEGFQPDVATAIDFYHPDDRPVIRAAVDAAIAEGTRFDHELRIVTCTGRDRWVHALGEPIQREGNVVGLFGTLQDITRRRRAQEERSRLEEKMLQTQKLESLGVLSGGIAHDFNNLLMAVLGNASLAVTDLSPVSPVTAYLEEIITAARRAADLSKQMLAYSGRGTLQVRELDLNEVVREMAHLMEVSISKTAVLKLDLAPSLPRVRADATQLRQIIMNLITNASEAIGDRSGVISLRTGAVECSREYLASTYIDEDQKPGLFVYAEISDTGCGMDTATQTKLFDPFFTTKFTGRGLGLAAVLGIVRAHRGAIKVYSEPQKGTTIKILFPATADYLDAAAPVRVEPKAWSGSGLVLLVDDDETSRSVGSRMLRHLGFEVVTANDGLEGVARFRELAAELRLVVLDLTMPHMDGRQAFSEMRLVDSTVPVLVASGYSEEDVSTQFAGKGLSGFLQKPYEMNTLTAEVRRILEP